MREKVSSKVVKNCILLIIYNSGGSNSGLSWPDEKKKIIRWCGTIHKPKSKCTKCINFESLLQIEIWKSERRCGVKLISKSKWSQKPFLEHFWKLGCGKNTRRSDGKYISKSKYIKNAIRKSTGRHCAKHTAKSNKILIKVGLNFF